MPPDNIFQLRPNPFQPSTSFAGDEPRSLIRGENVWLRPKGQGIMYASAYKGSKDISETIPTKQITGQISWVTGQSVITGTGTAFKTELHPSNFVCADVSPSAFFVIEEITSDTSAIVSRAFTTTQAAPVDAHILPVIDALGRKRVTYSRGKVVKFPRGNLIGVGSGTVKINGQDIAIQQVEVMTVLTPATANGNITVTVTASGLTGSPIALSVAVLNLDTTAQVAAKIQTAMAANANIAAFSDIAVNGSEVHWIKKAAAANDTTMNLAVTASGGTGVTSAASSTNLIAGNTFALSSLPQYAIFNSSTSTYRQIGYGISLVAGFTFTLTSSAVNGVKQMQAGRFGVCLVAKSTDTLGYSNPSTNVSLAANHTVNKKLRITFGSPMNTAEGQNAYDIYVTKFEDSVANINNALLGPWYFVEEVTAAQIATENSVSDGTVSGLFHDFEFADGELEVSDRILTFDNFPPLECSFVDILGTSVIFFSAEGIPTATQKRGLNPGPSIIAGKPDNPEAIMRDKTVKTIESDTILGVLNPRSRWWLMCENSLQTAVITGLDRAPITCRTFWNTGFRNPYNMSFYKDYSFGFSTQGLFRSINVGDTSQEDFNFSKPVDDFVADWICAHVLSAYDPKNKAWCFFFAGRSQQSGYWVTMVLPYLYNDGIWNPPILLKRDNTDFIVSGAATVGQSLYFLAGGRKSTGQMEVKTYEFDTFETGVSVNCYLAWNYTDMGIEELPQAIEGMASAIGNFEDGRIEIHGVDPDGTFDLTTLENGHGNALYTIDIGDRTGLGRKQRVLQNIPHYSKWTARFSFTSTDGTARIDEINLLPKSNHSRR